MQATAWVLDSVPPGHAATPVTVITQVSGPLLRIVGAHGESSALGRGVAAGGFQAGVAEVLGDDDEVGPAADERRREGVPKDVGGRVVVEARGSGPCGLCRRSCGVSSSA